MHVVSGCERERFGSGIEARSHICTWSVDDVMKWMSRLKPRGSLRTMPTNTEMFCK